MRYQTNQCDRCKGYYGNLVEIDKYGAELCYGCVCDMITAVADTMPESERNAWLFGGSRVVAEAINRQGGCRPAS